MRRPAFALCLLIATTLSAAAQPAKKSTGCDLPNADTIVHGIKLGDSASAIRVLGRDFRTVVDNPASDFGWSLFASRDNKQLFLLRHHAGDLEHSYLEFEVKFGRHDRKPKNLPVYEFITGKGVKLGLKRKPVLAKFGPCFKSVQNGEIEVVRYEIKDDKAETGILKTTNMPQYYAEYEFRNGVLVRFKFAHEPV